jgi:adenylate cyclase
LRPAASSGSGAGAGLRPAIAPILQGAAGAGFPGTIVDPDGIRRRIELIRRYDDRFFAQLAMAPLLDWLGNPPVILEPDRIRLAGARLPEGGERDLSIPLAEDGCLLLDWPPKSYLDSYRHLPFHELALHRELERRLLRNLQAMEEAGLFDEPHRTLLELYRYAQTILWKILESGDRQPLAEYRRARERFFREADRFLQGETEQELLGRIQTILDSDEAAPEEKQRATAMDGRARELFSSSRGIYRELARSRATLREYLPGAFCIIGLAGTSAAETGVTPFGEQHGNTGAHAAVVNTILGSRFLDDLPWWYPAVLAVLLAGDLALLLRNLRPLGSILAGAAVLLLLLAGGGGFFLGTGVYPGLLTPAVTVLFTSLALASMKLLRIGRERRFLRRAFGHGITADAIEELIDQPSVLQLGGEKRILTAMFTGVKDSATLFGRLDPAGLVKLTRGYLTEMSDIILDLKGTIDRYEGHTIASFFGAPLACPDHASRACLAAVRMKKAEALLSERLSREGLILPPLLTRIGINTGEMVVGDMGSARWMDYTIMGDAANLAARLVGVNRQYGTWILIGESTCRAAEAAAAGPADHAAAGTPSDDFLLRKMDRVKVAGIAEPVRLFELLDEKSSASPEMREAVEAFHQGLRHFEAREWTAARRRFQEVLRILPGDGPSRLFLKRCIEFSRNPPPVSWDGVFSLSMK